jgi:hypothetical protein
MATTLYVDLDHPPPTMAKQVAYLRGLLPARFKVYQHGDALAVDVPDGTDPQAELVRALDEALVPGYVYTPDPDVLAANNLSPRARSRAAEDSTE